MFHYLRNVCCYVHFETRVKPQWSISKKHLRGVVHVDIGKVYGFIFNYVATNRSAVHGSNQMSKLQKSTTFGDGVSTFKRPPIYDFSQKKRTLQYLKLISHFYKSFQRILNSKVVKLLLPPFHIIRHLAN